jgi:hypothetical protein
VNYRREKGQFAYKGVHLNSAVDSIPKDKLGIATNVRVTQQGTLGTRPAIAPFLNPGSAKPVTSIKTFTAEGSPTRRFSGAGTSLYMDGTEVDTGFSGNPISYATYQPAQAVEPFLYAADSQRYSKVRASDGKRFNVGIAPPAGPPDANLIQPLYSNVDNTESSGFLLSPGWMAGGTAGTPTAIARVPASTIISQILYDSGSTGWACVSFSSTSSASTSWLQKGLRLGLSGTEWPVITEMIAAAAIADTTIAAIEYDSGTSGLCCVVLASNSTGLARNSLLMLNSELVRVLSVAVGEDNSVSFRCSTVNNHSAGETVQFFDCARVYLSLPHPQGDAVTGYALGTAVTTGVGTVTNTFTGGAGPTLMAVSIYPDQKVGAFFTALNIYVNPASIPLLAGIPVGTPITITGSAGYDGTYPVTLNPGPGGALTVAASVPGSSAPYVGPATLNTVLALDLSQINGRPVTQDDWMHISLLFDVLTNVSLIRILLDVDSTTNDFAHNYYYAEVTSNVFQQAALGLQSNILAALNAVQTSGTQAQLQFLLGQAATLASAGNIASASQLAALQGQLAQLEIGLPASSQLYTGASQWSEIFIPLSNLTRVGADSTVGLHTIKAIRIEITCTGIVNAEVDSWWFGGTYGPNAPQSINPENPIKYCFRYRSTITGAQSTWSPLDRGGEFPERQGIAVSGAYSADPQVDTVDLARVGASVDGTPQYLAFVPNNPAGGAWSFIDNYADAQLGDQIEPGDNQPWPIQQQPITGTCSVVGTTVFSTSVAIPSNLCEGTIVLVNGVATVIRGLPTAHAFQVEDNLDTGTMVPFQINSPTTFGNPLPYLAGPFDECFFAMGDPLNPTRIYFSNRTNPDTARTSNFVDLPTTNAGVGVGIFNGYVIAMTSEEFIIGTNSNNPASPYSFTTTSVGAGLLQPWAFTIGPAIFFWTRNGIAVTDLGPAKSISNEDLYPYLPHEGLPGTAVNGYLPPPVNVAPRFGYCKNGWLYMDFQDTGANWRTLEFDTTKPGWWFDEYNPGVALHYQDEAEDSDLILCGCADGTIQQFESLAADTGGIINCQVRLGANNFDDIRSLKQAIDLTLNLNGTVTAGVLANSWTVPVFSAPTAGVIGTVNILPVAPAYDPTKLYLDFALDFTWTGIQSIVEYDLGYLQNPLLAADFVANPTELGFSGYGHCREIILNCVTKQAMAANLVIQSEFPGTITIPLNIAAGATRQYISLPPNKGMLYEWSLQGIGGDFGMFSCDAHVKGWTEEAYRTASPFVE